MNTFFIQPILFLCVLFCAFPVLAEYNPVTQTPLEVMDQLPGADQGQTQEAQELKEHIIDFNNVETSEDGIMFGPERGIILPEEIDKDEPASLDPSGRQEDYLMLEVEKQKSDKSASEEAQDDDRSYIQRQVHDLISRGKNFLLSLGSDVVKHFPELWKYLKIVNGFVMGVFVVASRLPLLISIPVFIILYILVCYPLMKLAHTITGDEWMAWTPLMHFFL